MLNDIPEFLAITNQQLIRARMTVSVISYNLGHLLGNAFTLPDEVLDAAKSVLEVAREQGLISVRYMDDK